MLLMEHVCWKSFTPLQMARCSLQKLRRQEWDSAGLLLRNSEGPRVLFVYSGSYFDLEYDEFLRLPFFNGVGLRKLKTNDPAAGHVSEDFAQQLQ